MSQLEKLFKDSLQNEQAPFDPKAWSAMEHKLNQSLPVQASNAWKWVATAVGTAAVATVAIYSTSNNNEASTPQAIIETNTPVETSPSTDQQDVAVLEPKTSTEVEPNTTNEATNNEDTPAASTPDRQTTADGNDSPSNGASSNERMELPVENDLSDQQTNDDKKKSQPTPEAELILPELKTVYCQNETIELFNKNEAKMTVKNPSGSRLTISKGQSGQVELAETGKYVLTTSHSNDQRMLTFEVVQAPSVDFRRSNDFIYKEGIPYLEFETMDFANQLNWTLNGKTIGQGDEIGVTAFKQGDYKLRLEATDAKGCTAETTQTIHVDRDYNLMAELALRPKSNDRAVNTFMPDALELRNTGFTLIIMDKGTGGTIYQTSDSNQGWNGIDSRTGEMVQEGVYLWKVVLTNPLPGEKNVYLGTVNVLL